MIKETLAGVDDLLPLYNWMDEINVLAPWEWMYEGQVFGVQSPETGELGFVSVMGNLGAHFAIALYQGAYGLSRLVYMRQFGPVDPEYLLHTPQLQASFEDRSVLEDRDRQVIRQLKRKYQGRDAWPMFRAYRPGYRPYPVTPEEARFLGVALEQLLIVAPRLKANRKLLSEWLDKNPKLLIRVPKTTANGIVWEDQQQTIRFESLNFSVEMDTELLTQVKNLPQQDTTLEVHGFMGHTVIGTQRDRPRFEHVFLMVEPTSTTVIAADILEPVPDLKTMWEHLPVRMVQALARAGYRPRTIATQSDVMTTLLSSTCDELKIRIREQSSLPALDYVRQNLNRFMSRLKR